MIQRVQSIFFLLAAAMMSALFSKPMAFATIFGDAAALRASDQSMLADGVFEVNDHIILLGLVIACIALPMISLLLFKNRSLQIRLSRATIAALCVLLALSIILFMQDYKLMSDGTEVTIEYGYISPVLAIIFIVLALRFIKKDDRLVKSADRLR